MDAPTRRETAVPQPAFDLPMHRYHSGIARQQDPFVRQIHDPGATECSGGIQPT